MTVSKSLGGSARLAAEYLSSGKPAIVPCDTIYGIVGRVPDSQGAIQALKGRGDDKPFIVFIAEPSEALGLAGAAMPAGLLALWPGPLTVILGARGGGSLALRCPSEPWVRELLAACGFPLYTTSVNRSGSPALSAIRDIEAEFGDEIGLIVDGGDMAGGRPSTLLDAREKPYKVLRQGELVVPEGLLV